MADFSSFRDSIPGQNTWIILFSRSVFSERYSSAGTFSVLFNTELIACHAPDLLAYPTVVAISSRVRPAIRSSTACACFRRISMVFADVLANLHRLSPDVLLPPFYCDLDVPGFDLHTIAHPPQAFTGYQGGAGAKEWIVDHIPKFR